jgi:hypothetical protein
VGFESVRKGAFCIDAEVPIDRDADAAVTTEGLPPGCECTLNYQRKVPAACGFTQTIRSQIVGNSKIVAI